jgi:hypothetical protein
MKFTITTGKQVRPNDPNESRPAVACGAVLLDPDKYFIEAANMDAAAREFGRIKFDVQVDGVEELFDVLEPGVLIYLDCDDEAASNDPTDY